MAVRFDANADYLRISSGLFDYNAGYTVMCWAYPVSNPTAQITLFSVANNSSNLDRLRSNSGGTTWSAQSIVGGTSINTNGSSVSYGSWQHWAMVRRDSSNLDTYLNGVLDATSNQSVSGRSAAAQLDIGNTNGASAYFNGRVFAIKIWNVALTAAEIAQEMRTIRPIRLANLWAWVPARPGSGERAKDYSGNGHDFTEGGTLTDEDPGPISWGARSGSRGKPPGTQYSQSIGGALTTSGAITRQTGKRVTGALTTSGVLARQISKRVVGALTTSGAVGKQTSKQLAGALTTSGAVATARIYIKALAGALTTSGVIARQTGKRVAGALTTSGVIARQTAKQVAGALTSSGAVSTSRAYLKAISGALTTSGVVGKQTSKQLAGALATSGALARQTSKRVAGILTIGGTIVRQTGKRIGGALTTSGAVATARRYTKALAGALTTSGTVAKQTGKRVAGALTTIGAIARQTAKRVAGSLTTSGGVTKRTSKALAGVLTSSGSLLTTRLRVLIHWTFAALARRRFFRAVHVRGGILARYALTYRHRYEALTMALAEVAKDPDETIDVTIDYTALLDSDTIVTSSWLVAGVTSPADSKTTTTTTVRISGGTLGQKHKAKNTIVTSSGQTFVRRLLFVIQEL